jgi:lysophospholipase L1-like esterase
MNKLFKIVLLIFVGLAIGLLFAEVLTRLVLPKPDKYITLLRMRAPDLQMDQHTNVKNPGYNPFIQRRPYSEWICDGKNPEKMNNEGFRGRNFVVTPSLGKTRIAAMGDSFTEGWMGPHEPAFPHVLEKELSTIEVLNFGMANRSPLRYVALYDQVVRKYRPKIVLVCLYRNDLSEDDNLQEYVQLDSRGVPIHFDYDKYFQRMPRMPQTKWEKRRDKWQWYLCQHSYFYPYAAVALTVDPEFRRRTLEAPAAKGLHEQWNHTQQNLETLHKLVQEGQSSLMLAYVPDSSDFDSPNALQGLLRDFSRQQSISYFDATEFLNTNDHVPLYIVGDGHFSEKGHERYGKLIAAWLKKEAGLK